MAKRNQTGAALLQSMAAYPAQREIRDTDPEMLFAIWDMEAGVDPDAALDELKGAVVVYDKFRPRISKRFSK